MTIGLNGGNFIANEDIFETYPTWQILLIFCQVLSLKRKIGHIDVNRNYFFNIYRQGLGGFAPSRSDSCGPNSI